MYMFANVLFGLLAKGGTFSHSVNRDVWKINAVFGSLAIIFVIRIIIELGRIKGKKSNKNDDNDESKQ